jgi:putative endonuclease
MAVVYILYSGSLNKFYTGSCKEIDLRIEQHLSKLFPNAFTAAANDWSIYFSIENLNYLQARKIERHIKKMKSRKFIENLKKYPAVSEKLVVLYKE